MFVSFSCSGHVGVVRARDRSDTQKNATNMIPHLVKIERGPNVSTKKKIIEKYQEKMLARIGKVISFQPEATPTDDRRTFM